MDHKNIFVLMEINQGQLFPVSLELINIGKQLACQRKQELVAILIGKDIQKIAEEILYYGVDRILLIEGEEYENYSTDAYTYALENVLIKHQPLACLLPATPNGRDLGGRISARMNLGLVAGCTDIYFQEDTNTINWVRPTFNGKLYSAIQTTTHPQIGTIDMGVFRTAKKVTHPNGKIEEEKISFQTENIRTKFLKFLPNDKPTKKTPLEQADIVVCAGMGVGSEENIQLVKDLADALGATFGVTKLLVDARWAPYDIQIGVTGVTVSPKLYIGVGVSGAGQHWHGIKKAKTIIAINKDKDAPIMHEAHYSIVGDLFEILPPLIEKIKKQA